MNEICFKCGDILCEVCNGTGVSWYGGVERDCPDCKGTGCRKTEVSYCDMGRCLDENADCRGCCHSVNGPGTDSTILCLKCKKINDAECAYHALTGE